MTFGKETKRNEIMTSRQGVLMTVVAITLAFFLRVASSAETRTHPNIILVFVDDMGWADFSCFGNSDATTPNIDRMAREGISFKSFYVNSPICSPSRVAISTGTYPQRWNITSYLANRKSNTKRGMANWLDPKAPMLARSLQQAGYATGHFGKWHMGGQRDVADAPAITEYGFDESLTNFEGMGAKLLPLTMNKDGKAGKIWGSAVNLGKPVTWMQRSEITTGFIDAAIPFMKKAQEAGKPFYVNVWPDDVHSPYWPSYQRIKKTKNKRELYLAVLEEMDKQFATLFDFIRADDDLRANTIILICSDNGPEKGAGQSGVLKGFKTHLFEGGIRSSLIVWAPGMMKKDAVGSINKDSVFAAIDLTPSLLKLAGAKAPVKSPCDGENVLDTLLGRSNESRKAPIFFSRPPDRKNYYGFKNLPDLAMRHGKWKLLCDYDGGRAQLYDIISDPAESKNMADIQPERANELSRKVVTWHHSMPNKKGADDGK
jgi:arylsulfatase A-like enzyme